MSVNLWRKIKSHSLFKNKYFELREDQCEMSDGKIVPRYFVLDFPDWVQVVALDKQGRFVLVNQYRYPGEGRFLEFPGGSTKPTRDEEPLDAAKRELREETGYDSEEWEYVGQHYPNPALMGNRCHVFFARNCVKKHELELDPYEVLSVVLMPREKFDRTIVQEQKINSLMLATYHLTLSKISF